MNLGFIFFNFIIIVVGILTLIMLLNKNYNKIMLIKLAIIIMILLLVLFLWFIYIFSISGIVLKSSYGVALVVGIVTLIFLIGDGIRYLYKSKEEDDFKNREKIGGV